MTAKIRRRLVILFCALIALGALAVWWEVSWLRFRAVAQINEADTQSEAIHITLQNFKAQYGRYPSGDSSAIFAALHGQNPQKVIFLTWSSARTAADGCMLDPWGTPYQIEISSNEILVRSARTNIRFDNSSNKDAAARTNAASQ